MLLPCRSLPLNDRGRCLFQPGRVCPGTPPSQPAPAPKGTQAVRDAPAAQGLFQGALPGERSLKLLGWVSGEATLPPCSPAGLPPAWPAPRPGTSSWLRPPPHCLQPSSSETASEAVYASLAAVARRMSTWRREGSGHEERPGGSEEASTGWEAGRLGFGLQHLRQRRPRGQSGGEGRGEQTSRSAQPRCHSAAWRPRAPIRTLGALEPRPRSAEGRALAGGSNADQPGENNLLGPSSPEQLVLRSGTPERAQSVGRGACTAARALGLHEKANVPRPSTRSPEPALPSPAWVLWPRARPQPL